MELMVVLLIIGILSTVALRTIDATRDRSLFDQTAKEMNTLVQAMVGNPDLTYDGRRVDFGYFGDEEKLPDSLRYLIHHPPGDTDWHGPYLRITAAGDSAGYLLDGWGNPYTYNPDEGTIASTGNGKYPMTVRVADSLRQLSYNTISGTVTDRDGNPPGKNSMTILTVNFFYNNQREHAGPDTILLKRPDESGYYEMGSGGAGGLEEVPIGTHKMTAVWPNKEVLTRWVTVVPRSRTIVDFKFSRSFYDRLRLVGTPELVPDLSGFKIFVVNDQPDDVTLTSLLFLRVTPKPESTFMRTFYINGVPGFGFPLPLGNPNGVGQGDSVRFVPPVTIAPDGMAELMFQDFYKTKTGTPPDKVNVSGMTFVFRFSDGSEIEVTLPNP